MDQQVSATISDGANFLSSHCSASPILYTNYTAWRDQITADISFDTAVLECTVPANCPLGQPEQFWWGPLTIFGAGGVAGPSSYAGYATAVIGCNTQIVGGTTAYFGTRWHFQGGCNTYTPDIRPQSYTFTSTADLPLLANVGPASPTTYMTGYPAPTPVTSGSGIVSTSVTLNYTDASNKTFQTYTNGANTYGNILIVSGITGDTTWNCTGTLPTGVSPPTNCYVINQGCTAGACFVTYANSAVATTSATVTSAKVLIQTIDLPVSVPAAPGCMSQPCAPPGNITYQTTTAVTTGVTPVGPGNGFVVYATGATNNTNLYGSTQSCMSYGAGESDPGMGVISGVAQTAGPPGEATWVTSLDISGGNVNHLILTASNATVYGFSNFSDCPAGSPFSFSNSGFGVLLLGSVPEIWFDHIVAAAAITGNNLSGSIGDEYVTSSRFSFIPPAGGGIALMQNTIMANLFACWSEYYVIENSTCIGMSPLVSDPIALAIADPTLPPLSPIYAQPTVVQLSGYAVPAYPATATIQMQAGAPPHVAIGWSGSIQCVDAGNSWTRYMWVTGFNFPAGTVTFGSNSGPLSPVGGSLTIPSPGCVDATVSWDAGIHTDFNFTNLGFSAGLNFPAQMMINEQTINGGGLWLTAAGGPGSFIDNDYEYDNFAMDSSSLGVDTRFSVPLVNALFLHNSWSRGQFAWGNGVANPGNNDVYVINSVPNYQITGISLPGGAGTSIETVTYTDSTNTVQPVGETISVLATTFASTDDSNNTTWAGQVLASPAPGCSSGTCHLSFNNLYNPTGTMTSTAAVLQIPTVNPPSRGSEGCVWSGEMETSVPTGTKIWPAWNGGTWSAANGLNDIPPWYPTQSGTGPGSC